MKRTKKVWFFIAPVIVALGGLLHLYGSSFPVDVLVIFFTLASVCTIVTIGFALMSYAIYFPLLFLTKMKISYLKEKGYHADFDKGPCSKIALYFCGALVAGLMAANQFWVMHVDIMYIALAGEQIDLSWHLLKMILGIAFLAMSVLCFHKSYMIWSHAYGKLWSDCRTLKRGGEIDAPRIMGF